MVSRLNFQFVSVVVVLALVLVQTFVESQYYLGEPDSRPLYVFNSDDVAHPAQPYFPEEEGRGFGGKVLEDVANAPGRMFAARKGRIDSEEEDDEEEDSRPVPAKLTVTLPKGRTRPVKLPPNFDDKVKKRMKMRKRSRDPLHGDPDPIDEMDEEGRKPEARLLWPFSIEITKGNQDKNGWDKGGGGGGWGPPGAFNSPPPPFAAPPGYPYPPVKNHDHPPYFDNDKEYDPDDDPEVQKLRIELFKMKKRTKKWKKIVGYNLAEIGAQIVTKVIEFLEFI